MPNHQNIEIELEDLSAKRRARESLKNGKIDLAASLMDDSMRLYWATGGSLGFAAHLGYSISNDLFTAIFGDGWNYVDGTGYFASAFARFAKSKETPYHHKRKKARSALDLIMGGQLNTATVLARLTDIGVISNSTLVPFFTPLGSISFAVCMWHLFFAAVADYISSAKATRVHARIEYKLAKYEAIATEIAKLKSSSDPKTQEKLAKFKLSQARRKQEIIALYKYSQQGERAGISPEQKLSAASLKDKITRLNIANDQKLNEALTPAELQLAELMIELKKREARQLFGAIFPWLAASISMSIVALQTINVLEPLLPGALAAVASFVGLATVLLKFAEVLDKRLVGELAQYRKVNQLNAAFLQAIEQMETKKFFNAENNNEDNNQTAESPKVFTLGFQLTANDLAPVNEKFPDITNPEKVLCALAYQLYQLSLAKDFAAEPAAAAGPSSPDPGQIEKEKEEEEEEENTATDSDDETQTTSAHDTEAAAFYQALKEQYPDLKKLKDYLAKVKETAIANHIILQALTKQQDLSKLKPDELVAAHEALRHLTPRQRRQAIDMQCRRDCDLFWLVTKPVKAVVTLGSSFFTGDTKQVVKEGLAEVKAGVTSLFKKPATYTRRT